jgi:hypothetical protein
MGGKPSTEVDVLNGHAVAQLRRSDLLPDLLRCITRPEIITACPLKHIDRARIVQTRLMLHPCHGQAGLHQTAHQEQRACQRG